MKTINLFKSMIFAAAVFSAAIAVNAQTQFRLNEVEIDPPSTTSNACQYAEIRVLNPSGPVPANTYFLSVNSDGANFGFANQAINFGGQTPGSDGTITLFNNFSLACPNRVYGAGTTLFTYSSPLIIGSGSETYLIVSSTANLFSGQDLDVDDDGQFDSNLGITVRDGFGLIVNPEEEFVYGAAAGVVNISNTISVDQPDAVTRFPGNTTAFAASAFYFGELAASPDETTAYAAPLSPNFPQGGLLTPGALNAPSVSAPAKAVVDFDGDGRTDYALTRNQNSLLVWYSLINGNSEVRINQWGLPGDTTVPADFDGDGKDDLAVWRVGNPTGFYILQSSNNVFRFEPFGLANDNPGIVGDWDGDGKADPAVYRSGAQSFFYYRGSANNPGGGTTFLPWGIAGDKPQRGDFDGDGKLDVAVFRSSTGLWYITQSSNSQQRFESFGLGSDSFVPADYDGDAKTDLAVFRNGTWYVRQSSNGGTLIQNWGLASDTLVPGDYDGDGKSDFGVWRAGVFWVAPVTGGTAITRAFGQPGDFAVATIFTE